MEKCLVPWCTRKYYAKGYCHTHWTALRRFGSPFGRHREEHERIIENLNTVKRFAAAIIGVQGILGDQCPFCLLHGKHTEDCVFNQAVNINK